MEKPGQRQLGGGFAGCKWTLLIGVCVAGLVGSIVTVPAWAEEDEKDYESKSTERLEKLTKTLSLTEAQQSKIGRILEKKTQKMQALHTQMKRIRLQSIEQIKAELTEDQKVRYQNMQDAHNKKHKRHGRHDKKKDRHSDDHD